MYDISFNGLNGRKKGVAIETRPAIPVPKKRISYVEIAGRNGSLTVTDNTYEDIELKFQMNFIRSPKWWHETAREVRNWLSGSGILRLENLYGWHYRVKNIDLSDMENINKMGGKFTAQFTCEPFQYKDGGDTFLPMGEVLINPYYECEPCYLISGSGSCTLTVNGNQFKANVTGGSIYIDTERKLTYNGNKENRRNATEGDYEDLFLKNGINSITISSGFTLTVKPNWRSI